MCIQGGAHLLRYFWINALSRVGAEAWRPSLLDFFYSGSYIVSMECNSYRVPQERMEGDTQTTVCLHHRRNAASTVSLLARSYRPARALLPMS